MSNSIKPNQAVIVLRHAMDKGNNGDGTYSFGPNVNVTRDDQPYSSDVYYCANFLGNPTGTDRAEALGRELPNFIKQLKLIPVNQVITIAPPVKPRDGMRTPNPFLTIAPYVNAMKNDTKSRNGEKLKLRMYKSNNYWDHRDIFKGPALLKDGFSAVIAWEKVGMWATEEDKYSWDKNLLLGSLAKKPELTEPQPVKGTTIYVYTNMNDQGRFDLRKYNFNGSTFTPEEAVGDKVALMADNGKFISADLNHSGRLIADRSKVDA